MKQILIRFTADEDIYWKLLSSKMALERSKKRTVTWKEILGSKLLKKELLSRQELLEASDRHSERRKKR